MGTPEELSVEALLKDPNSIEASEMPSPAIDLQRSSTRDQILATRELAQELNVVNLSEKIGTLEKSSEIKYLCSKISSLVLGPKDANKVVLTLLGKAIKDQEFRKKIGLQSQQNNNRQTWKITNPSVSKLMNICLAKMGMNFDEKDHQVLWLKHNLWETASGSNKQNLDNLQTFSFNEKTKWQDWLNLEQDMLEAFPTYEGRYLENQTVKSFFNGFGQINQSKEDFIYLFFANSKELAPFLKQVETIFGEEGLGWLSIVDIREIKRNINLKKEMGSKKEESLGGESFREERFNKIEDFLETEDQVKKEVTDKGQKLWVLQENEVPNIPFKIAQKLLRKQKLLKRKKTTLDSYLIAKDSLKNKEGDGIIYCNSGSQDFIGTKNHFLFWKKIGSQYITFDYTASQNIDKNKRDLDILAVSGNSVPDLINKVSSLYGGNWKKFNTNTFKKN